MENLVRELNDFYLVDVEKYMDELWNFEKNEPDDWEKIEHDYREAWSMSCRPDATVFPKVRDGDVIDEDQSVRWNREEVIRRKTAYAEEVKRLNKIRNLAVNTVTDRAVRLIADELQVKEEKARILWDFLYDKYHAYSEMFQHVDEYIDLISSVMDKS